MVQITDRIVRVNLVAQVGNYISGLEQARKKTSETATETKKLVDQGDAFDKFGKAGLVAGTLLATGVGLAISKFAEFDKAMSSVQASTHESTANMALLRTAAIDAGAKTVFTATDAAHAIDEMAKAGVSTSDILGGGLAGALNLASAGELDVADAAQIAATALTQFNLTGKDVPHVADLLAAGAGKAQGSVEDLSMALKQGGLVASQAGQSLEGTTGTLAAFASAGLIGSDAGTSLKTMLISLEKPSTAAQKVMDAYGINIYDASGHMLDFVGIAGQLKSQLGSLTDEQRNSALATIFGTDAVRAASVLYAQGSTGIQSWIDKTNDSGYAAETARLKLDNLAGDVEQLGGSFDTALIQSGSGANGMLRGMVQSVTNLVNGFSSLNPVAQSGVLIVAGLTGGILLLGGGFLTLVPKIAAARRAMDDLELTGGRIAKGFGKGGLVLAALDAVAGGVSAMSAQSTLAADELAKVDEAAKGKNLKDLDKLFHDANGNATTFNLTLKTLFSGDFLYNGSWIQGFNGAVDNATFGLTHLTESMDHNKATLRELGSQLATTAQTDLRGAINGFKDYVKMTDGSKDSINALLQAFPDYKAALVALAGEQGKNIDGQELLNLAQGKGALAAELLRDADAKAAAASADNAKALGALSGAAQDATTDIGTLADQIRGFGSAQLDTNTATRNFQAAIDDLSTSVATNGRTLDVTNEKGRANQAAVDSLAKSTLDLAAATITQTGNQADANKIIADGRSELIKQLGQFGITGSAAQTYADKLGLIPDSVTTAVNLNTTPADRALNAWLADNANHTIHVAMGAGGSGGITRANGGYISGPGTGTSDSIPAWLSNGEYVVNARQTAMNRALLESINAGSGRFPGYAAGGYVRGDTARYTSGTGTNSRGPAPVVTVPDIYVQNPFTGEYMLARMAGVVAAADKSRDTVTSMGWSPNR